MAEFRRFQRETTFEKPAIDMTEARGFQTLASKLQSFSMRQQDILDSQAALEGERRGQAEAAGKVGGVELRQEQTIRARAFNKGAQMAHAAAIQTDIRSSIGRMELQHKSDPAGFDAALQGYRDGLFEEIDPILRPHAETEIADFSSRAQLRILEQSQANQIKENAAQIATMSTGFRDDAMNAYRAGDLEMGLDKQLQLFQTWDEGVKDGVLDAEKVAKAKTAFMETSESNLLLGRFEKTLKEDGIEAAENALANARKFTDSDISPETRDKLVSSMETRLSKARTARNRELTRKKAESAAIEKRMKSSVDSAIYALDRGYIPEDLEMLSSLVEGTDLAVKLEKASRFAEKANEFSLLGPAEQEAVLTALMSKEDLSGTDVELLERYKKVNKHMESMLKDNPLQLAVEQGVLTGLPPIDLNNPETLKQRMLAVQTAESHYDRDFSPLTKAEVAQMSAAMEKFDADQKLAVLGVVVATTGDNSMEIMEQLDKSNHTILAMAGSLMAEGQADVARLAILGNEQIQLNKGILPKDADTAMPINEYLGTAFIANPRHQSAIIRATKSVYAALAADAGILDGTLDPDLLDSALEAVTGGVIMRDNPGWGTGDSYIPAPERGVSEDQFEDWIDGITAADIEAMGGVMAITADEAAKQVQEHGMLVGVGKGRYLVNVGTGYLLNPDGNPFELVWGVVPAIDTNAEDLSRIEPKPGVIRMNAEPGAFMTLDQAPALSPLGEGETIPLDSGVDLPVQESGPIPLDFGGVDAVLDVPEETGMPITEVPLPDIEEVPLPELKDGEASVDIGPITWDAKRR